ncbi:MAG: glucokinase [Gammaproteobacteria bacterium]|nr:glucokinase [Gammaproteobacteria bacterium]
MIDLIADIGGTNTRCALVEDTRITAARELRNDRFSSLTEALLHYLAEVGRPARLRHAALCVAAPVLTDQVRMVNIDWTFSRVTLARTLGVSRLHVVNDFTALSWALLRYRPSDLVSLGGGLAEPRTTRIVLGPGTGLGTGMLVPCESGWSTVAGEGGHVTLAAANEREASVIAAARRRYGHVSAERLVSGPGLAVLYATLAEVDGVDVAARGPAEITTLALQGEPHALATLQMFFELLGTFAGNLALSAGARGGVYLAGGILPRVLDQLVASGFRERFMDKGRYRDYLQGIPLYVVTHEQPAFPGLVQLLSSH